SLSGHQGAVEAVAFDGSEEFVAAGSAGGSVKLWDVEQGRVNRSFTGHRTHIRTVEFHPRQGEVIASGAADTTVKVWDIRGKMCIHTFTGHVKGVGSVAFSPDGKWLATGSEDGEIKLWDLRTCEELHSFKDHLGKITGLQYHPRELMLASASADRTVRLWDLDHFDRIDNVGAAIAGVRGITFSPDGHTLLKALPHGLEVLGWEPSRVQDIVDVPWKHVADMAVSTGNNRVIGCAFKQVVVQVWSVNLQYVQPFSGTETVLQEKRPPRVPRASSAQRKPLGKQCTAAKLTPSSSETSLYRTSSLDTWDSDADSMVGLKNAPVSSLGAKCTHSPSPVNPPVSSTAPSPRVRTSAHGRSSSSSVSGTNRLCPGVHRDKKHVVGARPGDFKQSSDAKSTGSMKQRSSAMVGHPKSCDGKSTSMVGAKKVRPSSRRESGFLTAAPDDLPQNHGLGSEGSSKYSAPASAGCPTPRKSGVEPRISVERRSSLERSSRVTAKKGRSSSQESSFMLTTNKADLRQSYKVTTAGNIKRQVSAVAGYPKPHDGKSSSAVNVKKVRPSSRRDNSNAMVESGDSGGQSYDADSVRSMRQRSSSISGYPTSHDHKSGSAVGAKKIRPGTQDSNSVVASGPGDLGQNYKLHSARSVRQHSSAAVGYSKPPDGKGSSAADAKKVLPSSCQDNGIVMTRSVDFGQNYDSDSVRSVRQRSSSIGGCPTPRECRGSGVTGAKKVRHSSRDSNFLVATDPGGLQQNYDLHSARSTRSMPQRSSPAVGHSKPPDGKSSSVVDAKQVHPSSRRDKGIALTESAGLRQSCDSDSVRSMRQRSSSMSGCTTPHECRSSSVVGAKKMRPSSRDSSVLVATDPGDLQQNYVPHSARSMRQRSSAIVGRPNPHDCKSSTAVDAKKVRPSSRKDNGVVVTESGDMGQSYDSDSVRSMRQRSSSASGCRTPSERRSGRVVGPKKMHAIDHDNGLLITTDPGELRQSYDSDSAGSLRQRGSTVVGCPNLPNGRVVQTRRLPVRSVGLQRSSSDVEEERRDMEVRRCGSADGWQPRPRNSRSLTRADFELESADLPSTSSLLSSISSLKPIPERRKDTRMPLGRQASGSRPGNASFDSYLPKRKVQGVDVKMADGKSDIELVSEVMSKRGKMQQILASRHSNLQLLRSFWTRGDVRGALRAARRCGDPSVVTDFLDAVGPKNGAFTLELIPEVTPSIDELVLSQHQRYRETALATLSTLLRSFGPVIHETTCSNLGSLGVDLSFEQRLEKCHSAKMSLQELVPKLERLEARQGLHGRQAKELRRRISNL
ncbi:unnamed protein product, partial [Ostreobium quekettii]